MSLFDRSNEKKPHTTEFVVHKEVEIRYTQNWRRAIRLISQTSVFAPPSISIEITDMGIRNHSDWVPYPNMEKATLAFNSMLRGGGDITFVKI